MEYKFTILTFLLAVLITTSISAQEMASCELTSDSGQGVDVQLSALNETPIGDGNCTYDFQATVSTDDGLPAANDVEVELTLTPDGSQPIIKVITLEAGETSITRPMAPTTLPFPCGQSGLVEVQILGSASASASCSESAMLPVELNLFDAVLMNDARIELIWETQTELENKGFDIERSRDGYKWENLMFVKGAGTTLEKQLYTWIDSKPYDNRTNYYRLKQIDYDNSYVYSEIVAVKMLGEDKISIAPNPVNNWLTVHLDEIDTDAHFDIYNVQGQIVKSIDVKTDSRTVRVSTSDLESGLYWLILSSNQIKQQIKFIKQ